MAAASGAAELFWALANAIQMRRVPGAFGTRPERQPPYQAEPPALPRFGLWFTVPMKSVRLLTLILLAAALPLLAEKQIVQPKEFPPGSPFSPAVLVDGTLYVSGQIGRDLKTQKVPAEFDAEVRQVLDNIGIILREAKMTYADVVSVQVYLTDMALFDRMN